LMLDEEHLEGVQDPSDSREEGFCWDDI